MRDSQNNIPWDLLTRYVAGECDEQEAAALSLRIEHETAVAAALADLLLQVVAVRDDSATHPQSGLVTVPLRMERVLWRSPLLWTVAACLALCLTALWFGFLHPSETAIVRITQLDGAVRWTGAGGQVRDDLKVGEKLPGGLLEALSSDSATTIAFTDDTLLTLLGSSSATVADDHQKRVHLRTGSLSASVQPQPKGKPLLIHTPSARLEVLGTQFQVDSDSSNTRLTVNEGRVRMTRLVDGLVAEVPAQHEALVTLNRSENLPVLPSRAPQVVWSSHFEDGPQDAEGRWLPAESGRPARMAAEPVLSQASKPTSTTLYRVNLFLPWKQHADVHVSPTSRLSITGRTASPVTVDVMLGCLKDSGGYDGNYFQKANLGPGEWKVELPVSAARKGRYNSATALEKELRLRCIAIYSINEDAGLEVDRIELLRD
jgi:hypothetical protein